MLKADTKNSIYVAFLYFCCGTLVYLYANSYSLYNFLNSVFGRSFITIAPIFLPLALAVAFFIGIIKYQKKSRIHVGWGWILAGIVCCAAALVLPDPRYGAKRIHVTEYLFLSLLVRYVLSFRLDSSGLLFFSCFFTGILGIHDEFLQGLHPFRTYGLKDMLVNGIAGIGGGFIWHGLQLFTRGAPPAENNLTHRTLLTHTLYLCWLGIAVLAMVIPMSVYLHTVIPLWLTLPLAASGVFWSCLFLYDRTTNQYGIRVVSCCSFLFLFYPVLINGFKIPFY